MTRVTVTLADLEVSAVMDTLIALEGFAARAYANRANDSVEQERYNALAAVVLPMRAALEEARDPVDDTT